MTYEIDSDSLHPDEEDARLLRGLAKNQAFRRSPVLRKAWHVFKGLTSFPQAKAPKVRGATGELVVVFRHVYISEDVKRFPPKARPTGFDHNKCFDNLVRTVKASAHKERVRIVVLYNGTGAQLKSDSFEQRLQTCGLHVQVKLLTAKSAVAAVLSMFRAVRAMPLQPDDIVYLLENDYLHADNWVDEVFEAYGTFPGIEYLSLYDHPDRYKFPHRYSRSTLYVTATRHWISAPSTCGTFLVKFGALCRDFKYLYSTKNDHQMFLRLTQKLKRPLLTPVPGLAVHCMSAHLDPLHRFEESLLGDRE